MEDKLRYLTVEKKRYSLVLPAQLWDEVQQTADEEGTTVIELIRRMLKLGLMVIKAQKGGGRVTLHEGEAAEEIRILF